MSSSPPRAPTTPPPSHGKRVESRRFASRREKSRSDDRTLSQRFLRAPMFDMSQFVWIENEEKGWALCTILKQDNTLLKVQDVETALIYKIDVGFDEVKPYNKGEYINMSTMPHIHEPAVMYNISRRYQRLQQHYTYVGRNVLVSVNPFTWDYQAVDMNQFSDKNEENDMPHPYALAERSYRGVESSVEGKPRHQTIVISGESGAGKTESSKLLMNYLTTRSTCGGDVGAGVGPSPVSISQGIVQSSPILEAFGNAKTLHNPNSSRFGKFIRVFFGTSLSSMQPRSLSSPPTVRILGAKHDVYLLEKSRVLGQAVGEQNFHIFYQYLSGVVNGSLSSTVQLHDTQDADNYRILNTCDSLDIMFDKFQETHRALLDIMDNKAVSELWNVIGGVLYLGNVDFIDNETAEGNASFVSGLSALQASCSLLGVDWKDMRHLLTQKVIETRDERFVVPLTIEGAIATRNAICKSIYETLFHFVLEMINDEVSCTSEVAQLPFVGVLDMFGFENMFVNGFNQFLINFANESLQYCFNEKILQSELELYFEENIPCELALEDCPDNSHCLALIGSSLSSTRLPSSILSMLESTCQNPKATDKKFCETMHRTFTELGSIKQHEGLLQSFLYTHPKDQSDTFKVKHYAGNVKYSVGNLMNTADDDGCDGGGWVEHNKDAVPYALEKLMSSSENLFLRTPSKAKMVESTEVATNSNNLSKQKLRTKSVAHSFSSSINKLCALLKTTECMFIRCVKPNDEKRPGVVAGQSMTRQIRSLALVQAAQVMQVGLKLNLPFNSIISFFRNYFLAKEEAVQYVDHSPNEIVFGWLLGCGIPKDKFRMGKTRVFFRDGFEQLLHPDALGKDLTNDTELIRCIGAHLPKNLVISKLNDVLSSRTLQKKTLSDFSEQLKMIDVRLSGVTSYLNSYQSTKMPSLSPFSVFFQLNTEAKGSVDAAHSQMEVILIRVKSLDKAIENSSAPVNEVEVIKKGMMDRIKEAQDMLTAITTQLVAVDSYSKDSRARVQKSQEEFNDRALDYWEIVSNVKKLSSSLSSSLLTANEGSDNGDGTSDLICHVQSGLSEILSLFAKLPNPHADNSELEESIKQIECDDCMIDAASTVITKGKAVVEEWGAISGLCDEAFDELEEAKKTLLHFKKLTHDTLRREMLKEHSGDEYVREFLLRADMEEDDDVTSKSITKDSLASSRSMSDRSVSFKDEAGENENESRGSSSIRFPPLEGLERERSSRSAKNLSTSSVSFSEGVEEGDTHSDGDFDDDDDDNMSVIDMDFWIVPNGWEEYYDADTQSAYYLNTITQVTQWERPTQPAEGIAGEITWASDTTSNPRETISSRSMLNDQSSNENSPKLKHLDREETVDQQVNQEGDVEITTDTLQDDDDDDEDSVPRDDSSHFCDDISEMSLSPTKSPSQEAQDKYKETVVDNRCNLHYGRVTTTQLGSLGTLPKEGHLMKQSTAFFMSRWTRKYFVLDGLRLECFDKSEHFYYGHRKPKVMMLSLSTRTSFTDDDMCFVVTTDDASGSSTTWTLAAPNHAEKNEWVTYINAHIYAHHCLQVSHSTAHTALDQRLMNATSTPKKHHEATSGVSFWQLLPYQESADHPRKESPRVCPVGIRTLPDIRSSRTGEGVFPGEHVEVVSTKENGNVTYLELADCRGWVFSVNPATSIQLFVPAVGYTYRENNGLKFEVARTEVAKVWTKSSDVLSIYILKNVQVAGIPIQFNPGNCSPYTGSILMVGEVVVANASFEMDLDLKQDLYVKLADGRGWVNTRGKHGGIGLTLIK